MAHTVSLVRVKGPTSICMDAEITDDGELVVSGQDVGPCKFTSYT